MRGYWGLAVYKPKTEANIGGLWRSAHAFGAGFLMVIGARYRRQCTDTSNASVHIPLFHYRTLEDFLEYIPYGCQKVAVELVEGAIPLTRFVHPAQAVYILGGEDMTLPQSVIKHCQSVVVIPTAICLNLSTAGSIVAYDRVAKYDKS